MNFPLVGFISLFICTTLTADQLFVSSDRCYQFAAEDAWTIRRAQVLDTALLDVTIDRAALTIARESADVIQEFTTAEVLAGKLELMRRNGVSILNQSPIATRQAGGMECAEVEYSEGKDRVMVTLIRESSTTVLTSITSCRVAESEEYLKRVRKFLDSIQKTANQALVPTPASVTPAADAPVAPAAAAAHL